MIIFLGDWIDVFGNVAQNLEATIAHGNARISIDVAINFYNSRYLHDKILH